MIVDADVEPLFAKLRERVQKAVAENVTTGEPISAVVRGSNGQAIVGTDRRAFVCKPGWMAGATLGAEVTSYSYLNVTAVQMHKGMLTGAVAIETGSSMTTTSVWGQGNADTYKAPNAIPVAGDWNEVRAGVTRLRQLVDNAHSPMISTRSRSLPESGAAPIADELRKLADLRSAGVLSNEEFEAAKRRALSG